MTAPASELALLNRRLPPAGGTARQTQQELDTDCRPYGSCGIRMCDRRTLCRRLPGFSAPPTRLPRTHIVHRRGSASLDRPKGAESPRHARIQSLIQRKSSTSRDPCLSGGISSKATHNVRERLNSFCVTNHWGREASLSVNESQRVGPRDAWCVLRGRPE